MFRLRLILFSHSVCTEFCTVLQDVKDKLVAERERLFSVLSDCPFLTPYPSAANFILCK